MFIQRYLLTDVDYFETSDLGAWCKGKDVAELEAKCDRYREALENIESMAVMGTAIHTIAHNALKG